VNAPPARDHWPTHERIRVAHCLEQVRSGGVERRRLSLAQRLDPDRFEQMVICTDASGELRREFENAGCRVVTIGALRRGLDWARINAATKLLRGFRPHIVHGAVFEGVIIAALAGRLARVPVIIAEETITPVGRRWTGHLYYRLLTGIADEVVAISKAVAAYLTKTIHLPRSKVRLIYNGVADPGPASAAELKAVRSEFGLRDGAPSIVTVGRLAAPRGAAPDSHKRVGDLISAMPAVLEQFPDAQLVVVGDGPDRPLLEQLACKAGIAGAVQFAGFRRRVRPFLEVADVLAHASESEGLPLVLVEAMFAARPIVASNVAGSNEVVADGETGFLVPVGHPAALASRIAELLRDPELRARMAEAGLQRARELFSEDRYVNEIVAMYEEVAATVRGCE
jgi:glycosyltransferase involved in cell wall biosynthesis